MIHENLHYGLISWNGNSVTWTGLNLLDEDLARATGVWKEKWDSIEDPQVREIKASEAFSPELRKKCK